MGIFDPDRNKIEVAPGMHLSRSLARHWPRIAASSIPYIHIDASPANDLPLTASKFGGAVLLPGHIRYPLHKDGRKMFPLAQLNFAEMPRLEGFPHRGWLLFFIPVDRSYGVELDGSPVNANFELVYVEEADETNVQNTAPTVYMYEHSPVTTQHALTFSLKMTW